MSDARAIAASDEGFRDGLNAILASYVRARATDHLDSSHRLWSVGRQLGHELEVLKAVRMHENVRVCWSFGQGAWARIPWIALLDRRVARATSDGLYVIYLFREDMSGVYATLNQGITREKERLGAHAGRATVRRRAAELRRHCSPMEAAGFLLDHDIDLHSQHALARDYQHGTVGHKLYEATQLPQTATLLHDLRVLLEAYDAIVAAGRVRQA
jgi:hypothetical protein